MQCHEFERVLEQHATGALPADAAAHLHICAGCRAMTSDLEAIQAAARELPAEVEPPERVWVALRAQLESEGLMRTPEPAEQRPRRWGLLRWLELSPRPALAGAYLTFLLVAALLAGLRGNFSQSPGSLAVELHPAGIALDAQLANVEQRTVSAVRNQDPAVTASLRQNLDIVDNFIALCEKSVREEPQNQMAREYLYGAYQQKAELLATMMDRGATGD